MARERVSGTSLRSKDATEGGGVNGAHATISEIGWVGKHTYGGRHKDKPVCALYVKLTIDGFEKPWENNYSAGPSSNWTVIEDGDGIRSTGKSTGLNKGCPAFLFLKSVEDAAKASGQDIDEILPEFEGGGNSVRPLEGMRVVLTQVKANTVGGDEKQYTVLQAFEEATDSKSKSTKRTNGSGVDVEEETSEAIKELLKEDGDIKKADLANEIAQAHRKNPNVQAMMELCFKDKFLAGIDGVNYNQKKGLLSLEG